MRAEIREDFTLYVVAETPVEVIALREIAGYGETLERKDGESCEEYVQRIYGRIVIDWSLKDHNDARTTHTSKSNR